MEAGTLYVDSAVGSRELLPLLKQRGVRSVLHPRLPADFACIGCGRGGADWKIGVERKTLSDLGSSLMMDRLFGTQLPRMIDEYDRIWLVVEGIFRPGDDDAIEVWRGGGWTQSRVPLTWSALQKWLLTYDEAVGGKGRRWRTSSDSETAAWLSALLQWWKKPYHRHAGHIAIEQNVRMPRHALLRKLNQVQETAFSFPKLGAKTALKVGRYFDSVWEMVNATEKGWVAAGVGKKDARVVYEAIRRRVR